MIIIVFRQQILKTQQRDPFHLPAGRIELDGPVIVHPALELIEDCLLIKTLYRDNEMAKRLSVSFPA